jgi:hypothetical protein
MGRSARGGSIDRRVRVQQAVVGAVSCAERHKKHFITVGGLLIASGSLFLVGCSGAAPKPPATAKYIEGDWRCLSSSEDGNKENQYTMHLRVTADHVSLGQARTGEELYWGQYGYDIAKDGTMTTFREGGGPGWVIQLPQNISYDETNTVRIAEGQPANLEVDATTSTLTFGFDNDINWACERGTFTDDGNTFLESEKS